MTPASANRATLGSGFTSHARQMAGEWLEGITLGGVPIGQFVRCVVFTVNGEDHAVWDNPSAERPALPQRRQPARSQAMAENEWHPAWAALGERLYTVDGPWVHPETRYELGDGYALARTGGGHLSIGCPSRDDPSAGRPLYRTDVSPWSQDLGVIAFPFHLWPVYESVEQGWSIGHVARRSLAAAVAEAVCHEALEMWQTAPGQPVINPHATSATAEVTVRFGAGSDIIVNPIYSSASGWAAEGD